MIEFIHCGDLHLGCMPGRLELRYQDFFDAFMKVVEYAVDNKTKYILVSGDFFHLKVVNSKTLQNALNCLEKSKENNIKVIVIEGNHDKAFYVDEDSWLNFLNNQHYIILLREDLLDGQLVLNAYNGSGAIYEDDNIRIIGLSYFGGSTEKYLLSLNNIIKKSSKYTVLMLHAAIDKMADQDMARVKSDIIDTLKDKVDYVALGHIHYRYEYDNFCYNPGALENIRIKDAHQGEAKGFYHVKINEKQKDIKYVNSSYRPVLFASLDATGMKMPSEVVEAIEQASYDVNNNEMMELSLYGKVDFNPYLINVDELTTYLKEKYQLLYIEVNNYINSIINKHDETERVDISQIVKELVTQEVKYNFPECETQEDVAKKMISTTDMLVDGVDEDAIIDHLLKVGVKL